jgi:lysophospholipase L1-like esterase
MLGVEVIGRGKDGERTSDMRERWPRVERECTHARTVLILGGGNDKIRPPEWTVRNLAWLHEQARTRLDADVGVLTHPPAALEDERLWDVNDLLRECVADDKTGRLFLCDTADTCPTNLIDEVHLSSEGYREMAAIVARSLARHLRVPGHE